MDWLTFKFCVLIWVLYVSKSQSQLLNSTSSLIHSNQSHSSCEEGQPVTPPDECNTCTCFAGVIYCTNFSCTEQECVDGKEIPQPDECNKCICQRGKVMCSNVICIPAPNCAENLLYPTQNKCNTCMCFNGFITCTSNVCYEENMVGFDPRGTKKTPNMKECIEGSSIPVPNKCVECFCENGKKRCKYICSPTMQLQNRFADQSHSFCEESQPVTPPDECNTCTCFAGVIYCTNLSCPEQECVNDEELPPPDECNKCICRRGQVMCSNVICIPAPNCAENQLYPSPNKCNTCMCFNGFITCTSNVCYEENLVGFDPRGTKDTSNKKECIEGSSLPGPNKCVECFCENGKKRCQYICSPTTQLQNRIEDQSHTSCEEGQPVTPPDECNTCTCFAGAIYCTNLSCPEQECVNGEEIPPPDACNKCICRRGQVMCSQMICIPAPNCAEKQLYPSPNKCNACMCLNGFITCTSNVCYEENWAGSDPRATTKSPNMKECIEGSSLPGPNKCVECFCKNGKKRCKYICSPTTQLQNRFAEPECFPDQKIPPPDDCNNCICFEGEIHCTHMPCHTDMRIGRECRDDQPVFRPDECNECYCFEGRLECSDLVCIRGSRCVPGQVIPKPDSCNACKCVEGHILCTNYQCPKLDPRNGITTESLPTKVKALDECQDGDVLPSLPPPHDCNTCYCIENTIMCTVNTCVDTAPEIKGRLKEQNEQINLQNFDKQISVEPFIDTSYKKNNKLPTKVIHTHAYNGFHQEIKVHANHLPKDATSLFKVLATSLDNAALASLSQSLLTSPDTITNSHDSKMPFNHKVVQNNLLGEGNVITTQSSKLITSGSQSNETIFVIPNTEPFESENLESILPLTNKHETIWKTVSAPATIVYHNNQPINPRNSLEENMNVHHDDRPPAILNSIQQSDMIRNPSKFSRPGRPRALPKPTRDTLNINTQYNPILYPKQININDGKNNYAPFYQEKNQFPSGFVAKRDELLHIPPYDLILNDTSPTTVFGPGKLIAAPNIQQKPLKSQFVPNQSKFYPNRFKPHEFQVIPSQNQPSQIVLPTFNNKAIQNPSLFPNTPNQPVVPANQYKPLQFGLKPVQGNPLMNPEHTQHETSHSQFVPNPSIYYKNEYEAPKINEVNPDEKQLLPHSKTSNTLTEHHSQPHTLSELDQDAIIPKVRNKTKRYNTTHSHYEKHTSITYVSDYDPNDPVHPKTVGHDPNQNYNAPHTNEFEHYSPDQESQELDLTRSKVNYYLNLPSQNAEYPTHQKSNEHLPSQTGPTIPNAYKDPKHLTTKNELPSSKLEMPQINHLLGTLDHRGSADGFQYPSNSAEKPNTSPHFDPVYPKDDLHITLHSQIEPAQNQHKPGILDDHGVGDEYHFAYNSNQNHAHLKPVYELPNFPLDPTQNQHKAGTFGEPESADRFQYPLNSAEDPIHSRGNSHIPQKPQLNPKDIHHLPGRYDDRGSADGFQYPSNSAEDPIHSRGNSHIPQKPQLSPQHIHHLPGWYDNPSNSAEYPSHPKGNIPKPPYTPLRPTQVQRLPGLIEDLGSAGGFRYPSNSAEKSSRPKDPHNPPHSQENLHKPSVLPFGPTQNQYLPSFHYPSHSAENPSHPEQKNQKQPNTPNSPTADRHLTGMFDERGSADGFQYPSHSAEDPSHPKQNIKKPPNFPYGPTPNQPFTGMFDDRGSADGFQYPSHSAEDSSHPKPSNFPYGPTPNQHLKGMSDDRGSADGFQYPFHSAEDPSHPKQNIKKPPNFPNILTPNQHLTGMFDDRGSTDGFQYPSHSAESLLKTKESNHHPQQSQFQPSHNQYNKNIHKQPNSSFGPMQDKHLPGMFDERESTDGFQYPSHSAERPLQTKNLKTPPQSQFRPYHNQYNENINKQPYSTFDPIQNKHSAEDPTKPKSKLPYSPVNPTQNQHIEKLDERGSANGFQYPSHSAENTAHQKDNLHNRSQSQFLPAHNQYKGYIQKNPNAPFGPTQNQYLPVVFDKTQSSSAENPTHPKSVTQNFPHPQLGPAQNHQNENILKPSDFPFGPILIHSLPEVLDDRGSADGFQYPSHSAEDPTLKENNPDTTPDSELLSKIFNDSNDNPLRPLTHLDHDQYKPTSFDDLLNGVHNIPWSLPDDNKEVSNIVTSTLQPRFEPDRDQFKPSAFDNLLNGVHDIPWSEPEDHEKVLSTITSAPKPRFKPEHDQYEPSSFENLFNEIHQIPWPIPNHDHDALGTDTEMTSPRTGFNPKKDQHEPSMIENPSLSPISNQNYLSHEDDSEQQIEQDKSAPNTELTNSDSTQFNPHPEIKPDSDPGNDLPIDDSKIPDYYDQLYPLFNAVKKLSEPPFDDSSLSVDQLDLLPFLFPGIAKILNYEPEKNQDDALPVEDHGFQRISPLLKLKSKFKQLPDSGHRILNWLKSKLLKFVPIKYNVTVNPNDIDMTKILHLLKKLTAPKIKDNAVLQNIPFGGFDPKIIENIMNDFQEDTFTTTPSSRIDTTHNYGDRFKTIPTSSEENGAQTPQSKYPDIHIILHQPNDEGDLVLPPYTETEGTTNLATDMSYEDLGDPLFSKVYNHRFRHRPKDQKDECGDGTHWISNCHGCSCYFGQPMCYKMHDCVVRTFGEPMACKPYSHFKMGCYTCECNGDGVAECDATDCNPKLSGKIEGTTEKPIPVFNKFFDSKKTDEILQYYNLYKKMPKDCPTPDLQAQYPTCERGTSWVSSCHKCECNENGQHECIKIDDCQLDFDLYGKPGRCKPNTKFYPKTNSMPCVECSCNDEGQPYCPTVDQKKH